MDTKMQAAVDHVYDLPRFTKKNSRAHTRRLMEFLGNPCADCRVIHVAGSNGKGSVCCYLYHMLLAGGATVGLFTSPHLVDLRERFQVNGGMVSEEMFLGAYERVQAAIGALCAQGEPQPTFFEQIYAIGMVLFEEADVEWIVLETGLGGRLDATNSFPTPYLTVITSIAREHTEILGDTIEEIAAEKAGILKPGVPLVFSAGSHALPKREDDAAARVIADRARELGCPAVKVSLREGFSLSAGDEPEGAFLTAAQSETFYEISKRTGNTIDFSLVSAYDGTTAWTIPGQARYQVQNAALAVAAMQMLRRRMSRSKESDAESAVCSDSGRKDGYALWSLDDTALQQGLSLAEWPGRMQEVQPGVWLDGAHNPAGITAFLDAARDLTWEDIYPPLLLVSMLREKDLVSAIALLSEVDWERIVVTAIPDGRSADPEEIAMRFKSESVREKKTGDSVGAVEVIADCREAFFSLRRGRKPGQKLFCTGSLYLVGMLLEIEEE